MISSSTIRVLNPNTMRQSKSGGLLPVKLALSQAQMRRASMGHQIQVTHSQIGHGHEFHVHPETHKKLLSAYNGGRGARIYITHSELSGSGFLDILKKVASPVISGIAGVAGELFPTHKETINKVREGVRSVTGYGIAGRKGRGGLPGSFMHAGDDLQSPEHFPGMPTDHYGQGMMRRTRACKASDGLRPSTTSSGPARPLRVSQKKKIGSKGKGINPSGFY